MSGFVNNSLSNLISSLNTTILGRRPEGRAVYSKFNLKILLFLTARGFLSDVRVGLNGSGGYLQFKFKTSETGNPIVSKIFRPPFKKNNNSSLSQYSSSRLLSSSYSSEFVLVSTSKGLMTAVEAAALGLGGYVVLVIL